jgi:hypothetical protein
MSVAVACNLSDGVILGVDSAITIGPTNNPSKVYEDAEKLFPLSDLPVGVATYGLAAIGDRTIGNLVHECALTNEHFFNRPNRTMAEIVERIRQFFMQQYMAITAPALAAEKGIPYDQIPVDERVGLGLVIGGFAKSSYRPEIWNIIIPRHDTANSASQIAAQGTIGAIRFAMHEPISRYMDGYAPGLLTALADYVGTIRAPFTAPELQAFRDEAAKFNYPIVFAGMPIEQGVDYVRFLVELVIGHYKYVSGAAIVGGQSRIGLVTYRGGSFSILK